MSARESVYVTRKIGCDPPPSPNSTVGLITVEIRVFYPPSVGQERVQSELAEAYLYAAAELRDKFHPAASEVASGGAT